MIASEWLQVCAEVQDLWPSQPWSKSTATTAFPLFESVSVTAAHKAVRQLADEGTMFAPPPPTVLALAKAIAKDLQPALPAPDITRDLTADEVAWARQMAAMLRGSKADSVSGTFVAFAQHAARKVKGLEPNQGHWEFCPACEPVAQFSRRPGLQSDAFPGLAQQCCAEGRSLFEAWRYAVDELRVLGTREPLQEQLPS